MTLHSTSFLIRDRQSWPPPRCQSGSPRAQGMSGTAVWWRSQEDILITGTMKTRMTSAGPQKVPALDVLNNFCSEARRVESSEKWFLLSSVWHSTRFHNLGQSRVAERASHKCALSPFLLLWCSKFKFWTSKTESRSQYFLTVSAGTSNTKCQISNSVHQYSAYPIYHRPAGLANFLRRLATKVLYVHTYVRIEYVRRLCITYINNSHMYP